MPAAWVSMGESSAATCAAVVFSNPFEVIKIRLQLQGELQKRAATQRQYTGTLQGLSVILRNEGIAGVQKGLAAAVAYQAVMNGLRLGLYDPCKRLVGAVLPEGLVTSLAAGTITGFVGSWAASPLFLVKTRMQARSPVAQVGTQHDYPNFVSGLSQLYSAGGVQSLWHGALVAGIRTGIASGVQLASYDTLKIAVGGRTGLDSGDFRLHVASSFLSSGIVAVSMNPFDVIMTRVYNNANREYSANFAASFAKVVKAEGVEGLFKGTTALWARVGPHTVLTFVFLERVRRLRTHYLPQLD